MALTSGGIGEGDVGGGLGGVFAVGGLGWPGVVLVEDVLEGILVGVVHVLVGSFFKVIIINYNRSPEWYACIIYFTLLLYREIVSIA